MPLSQRSFSANCYALSKVWFKCHLIKLRVQDVNFIISSIKSWLFQDLLLKTSELTTFIDTSSGGLGLGLECENKGSISSHQNFLGNCSEPCI